MAEREREASYSNYICSIIMPLLCSRSFCNHQVVIGWDNSVHRRGWPSVLASDQKVQHLNDVLLDIAEKLVERCAHTFAVEGSPYLNIHAAVTVHVSRSPGSVAAEHHVYRQRYVLNRDRAVQVDIHSRVECQGGRSRGQQWASRRRRSYY